MFQSLPQGIKISISRSIKTAFESYMARINWDENKYNFEDFVHFWRDYSKENASWFDKIDQETKTNTKFHQELTDKMNETIEKVLTTSPSQEDMDQLNRLLKEANSKEIDYSCKAEAKYYIEQLEQQSKKKNEVNKAASSRERKLAEIVYYQAYDKELPEENYSSEMIKKIIADAKHALNQENQEYEQDNNDMDYPIQ